MEWEGRVTWKWIKFKIEKNDCTTPNNARQSGDQNQNMHVGTKSDEYELNWKGKQKKHNILWKKNIFFTF